MFLLKEGELAKCFRLVLIFSRGLKLFTGGSVGGGFRGFYDRPISAVFSAGGTILPSARVLRVVGASRGRYGALVVC